MALRTASLFAGVGGLDLGVHIAVPGARGVVYVEREGYAAGILAARMRDGALAAAPIWDNVSTFDGRPWRGAVDLVLGGFPCTDISNAGKRAGIEGEHSGLWTEYARIVREIRPRFVFVENVAALLVRGLDTVLGDLAALGFDAEWAVFSAGEVGAPHRRERLFILAHASGSGSGYGRDAGLSIGDWSQDGVSRAHGAELELDLADSGCPRERTDQSESFSGCRGAANASVGREDLGHAPSSGRQDGAAARGSPGRLAGAGVAVGHAERPGRALGSGLARDDGAQRQAAERAGRALADPLGERRDGRPHVAERGTDQRTIAERSGESYLGRTLDDTVSGRYGAASSPVCTGRAGAELPGLFPPGPGDLSAWRAMPADAQPAVRRCAPWLASRVDRLRAAGNGVVALQAAVAFVELSRRLGVEW